MHYNHIRESKLFVFKKTECSESVSRFVRDEETLGPIPSIPTKMRVDHLSFRAHCLLLKNGFIVTGENYSNGFILDVQDGDKTSATVAIRKNCKVCGCNANQSDGNCEPEIDQENPASIFAKISG